MSDNSSGMQRKVFKIVLLGHRTKSELMKTFSEKVFVKSHIDVLGVDFAEKYVTTAKEEKLVFQMWDISSKAEFADRRKRYHKGATAIILVFDISEPKSFFYLPELMQELTTPFPVPLALVGILNQFPGEKNSILINQINAYIDKLTLEAYLQVPYIEINTKTSKGVEKLTEFLTNIEYYKSLLTDFNVTERQQMLLAQSLYEKVKQQQSENPNLDDLVKYLRQNSEVIMKEFQEIIDPNF